MVRGPAGGESKEALEPVRFYGVACSVRRYPTGHFPLLCGDELLIRRYRSECFQLDEPEWMELAEFGECPRLRGLPHGLTRYDDGWRCYRCGARPFWPLHYCWQVHAQLSELGKSQMRGGALARAWPHLCEDFPDEEPETLGWLGCCCWVKP